MRGSHSVKVLVEGNVITYEGWDDRLVVFRAGADDVERDIIARMDRGSILIVSCFRPQSKPQAK